MATPSVCRLSLPSPPASIPPSSASSSNSLSLPTLHSLLSASLSPCQAPRRSPLSPSLRTWSSWPLCLRPASVVVLSLAFVPRIISVMPCGPLQASPFRTPSPVTPLPSSHRPLQLLAPPLALLPPAPAADIARKDKDVGNWTSGVVARGSVASGSAPCGKRAAPYSYTYPSSSTPCTAGRHRGICTIERTGPWWSRSSSGCNYRTA